MKAHSSRDVLVGLRPSDLVYADTAPDEEALRLHVKESEYIGAQSVLICDCGSNNVTVEVNSETPMALGETLTFRANPERIHVFDKKTEQAI